MEPAIWTSTRRGKRRRAEDEEKDVTYDSLRITTLKNENSTMNYNESYSVSPRQPTLPPVSNRTLTHPSFMPLYLAVGFTHQHADCGSLTVLPLGPAECFYSDPTLTCGRIPNVVFECFELNTPPPVMSPCPAPPPCPDPFKFGPNPTRNLGHLTLEINNLHPAVQKGQVVLQLTQEEDQAITNLLTLHYQEEPLQMDETLTSVNPNSFCHPETIDFTAAPNPCFLSDLQYPGETIEFQQGRCWSETELDAANTLLSCSRLVEQEGIIQGHNKSSVTLPLLHLRHEDSSRSSESQHVSETSPAFITTDCAKKDWGDLEEGRNYDEVHLLESSLSSGSKAGRGLGTSVEFTKVKDILDSEGDAVHVLLSLGDTGV
ncbi:uncharacterized protein LOC117552707 isoform X2 [Gymnodraco acuticeps]|uniref:Uncharacterized protein LOC117552707 isoform X2 n=1 Tax=Gymnodraco acuticeps TaxID=8218 RepID=A0A6P8W3J5_GYMAC|nr:uncharacterized protein LOC117552707 isoform X2 [Gymnodraco acuticeps]